VQSYYRDNSLLPQPAELRQRARLFGGRNAPWKKPVSACVHINEQTYNSAVSSIDKENVPRFSFAVGDRKFGRDPPPYGEIPCTCSSVKVGFQTVVVGDEKDEVPIHFYRDCAKNIAFGLYGRHFSARTRPSPDFVQAMARRTK